MTLLKGFKNNIKSIEHTATGDGINDSLLIEYDFGAIVTAGSKGLKLWEGTELLLTNPDDKELRNKLKEMKG